MDIQERVVSRVTILDLNGKLVLNEGSKQLREKVNAIVHEGRTLLVLNLEAVAHVDSSGLGEIVRTYTTLTRLGGKLKLLHADKRTQDLLTITKLRSIFDLFDSEAEALNSFA